MVLNEDFIDAAAKSIRDRVDAEFTHGAIGTGTSAENETDASLDNEILRKARNNITLESVSGGTSGATVSLFVTSSEANGQTITELGFFDSSSNGELQQRDTFDGVDKTSDIELFFDVQVDIEVS